MNDHDLNVIEDLSGTFNTHTRNNDFQKPGVEFRNLCTLCLLNKQCTYKFQNFYR